LAVGSWQLAGKLKKTEVFMAFEKLDVWKRSAGLSAEIYKELQGLKDFGFKDQITRSGLSIPSNIAEGMERRSEKEKVNFLSYAKGSCGELRTQVYVGMKIGYLPKNVGSQWIIETKEISAMLVGLINSIKSE
jgi:four helix bundle protein